MNKEALLKIRSEKKKHKPRFVRRNYIKLKLKNKWRKPRGLHNKLRLKRKGHIKNPSTGYRSPKLVRYLDKNGLSPIIVSNVGEISKLDTAKNSLIFSSTTGIKSKLKMLDKAQEMKFTVLNYKDIVSTKERLQQLLESRKKNRVEKKKIVHVNKVEPKKKELKDAKKELEEERKDVLLHSQEVMHKSVIDTPDKAPRMNVTRTKITPGEKK